MKTQIDSIIARYTSTRAIPSWSKRAIISVDAKAYTLSKDSRPYFSITAEITTPASRLRHDIEAGGCLHDEILRFWPSLAPIVALHLSDALTGEPMHAEANGWYWMAGALGGAGEQYHGASGSNSKTPDECLAIVADHLRISREDATILRDAVQTVCAEKGNPSGRNYFNGFIEEQRPRWQAEAQAGIALLNDLTARQTAKRAEREARKLAVM